VPESFVRNDDLNLSESGKTGGMTEESFCSNFVCCGVHLADLHALLQHYEDVHVKVQNDGDDEAGGQQGLQTPYEEDETGELGEAGEVDVVGDGGNGGGPSAGPGGSVHTRAPTFNRAGGNSNNNRRTDSVLSFGSTAAAESLLGVAANTANAPGYGAPPPGYYYAPPPHYYAPPQVMRGEQPVSAFDNTILRTVSPAAMAAAGGYAQQLHGYPGYYPAGPYYAPYYPPPPHMYHPQQQTGHPGGQMMVSPHHAQHIMYSSSSAYMQPQQPGHQYQQGHGQQQQAEGKNKRAKVPNMRAVQAASSTLREMLPQAALGSEHDPNQFKLIYSILSNTLTPSQTGSSGEASHTSTSAASASSATSKEQEAAERAAQAKSTAAAILAMPRAPVDKSLERPYICPVPGCGKAYKNPNGLKYHALHGHDGTQELVERPYRCPYGDCGKRYKNPNGLKYHVNKNHADMLPKSAIVARTAQNNAAGKSGFDEDDEHEEDDDSDAHDHSESELEPAGH